MTEAIATLDDAGEATIALTKGEAQRLERRALSLYGDAQRTTILLAVELRRLQVGGAHLLRGYKNFGDYVEATFEGISKSSAQQISRQGQVLLVLADHDRCSVEGKGEKLPGTTGVRALAVVLNRYGTEAMLDVYDHAASTGRGVIAETVASGIEAKVDAMRPELGEGDGGAGSEDDDDPEDHESGPHDAHGYDDDEDENMHELRDRLGMMHDVLNTIGDAMHEGNHREADHQLEALCDEVPQLAAAIKRVVEPPTTPTDTLPPHGPGCKEMDAESSSEPGQKRYVCVSNCPRKHALARQGEPTDA